MIKALECSLRGFLAVNSQPTVGEKRFCTKEKSFFKISALDPGKIQCNVGHCSSYKE